MFWFSQFFNKTKEQKYHKSKLSSKIHKVDKCHNYCKFMYCFLFGLIDKNINQSHAYRSVTYFRNVFLVSSISSKKQTKKRCIVVKTNSFVRLLEEFTAWQFAFEINWPLIACKTIEINHLPTLYFHERVRPKNSLQLTKILKFHFFHEKSLKCASKN